MDKEAQEKITDGFISDDAINGLLFLTEHERVPTWLELDRFIRAVGYRKLPEGEPPLLRQGGIDKIAHDTKDEAVVYGWDLQKSMDTMVDRFLTAQRDSDIKWIRGE